MTLKKIFWKKLEKVYYLDLDSITIYNWYKLTETNDYKWICRPNNEPDIRAVGVYQSLIYQFNSLNLDTLKERKEIVMQAIDIVQVIIKEPNLDHRVLDGVSLLIRALMIQPEKVELKLLKKLLNTSDLRFRLSLLESDKAKYDAIIESDKNKEPVDIYKRCGKIGQILNGMTIDPKTTTVRQFIGYEKAALEIIKEK